MHTGDWHELAVVGVAAFLVAVLVGGAVVLATGGRGRLALPRAPESTHRQPETLVPGWRWVCPGCERTLAGHEGLPVNFTICVVCHQRYKTRAELHRQQARQRENGHA